MPDICFDPVTGASGDMILAALFDLGADPAAVADVVRSGGLDGFEIEFSHKGKEYPFPYGCCNVKVAHSDHHHHHHVHRHLADILGIIDTSKAAPRAKERARKVFQRLAEAEAGVHGVAIEKVHFHEVGAVDSIVDVFGACIALEQLGVEHVYCSDLKIGKGTLTCAHGVLPVPAPATAKLLEGYSFKRLEIEAELTTPTGAAILTTLSDGNWSELTCRLLKCGVGHGKRELEEAPNIIRAFLVEIASGSSRIEVLETDIDDESPEILGALPERLRQAGALDVTLVPVMMKKNRPGTRISVIMRAGDAQRLTEIFFDHSSTIGLRVFSARRFVLPRQETTLPTPWGEVRAKRVERPGGPEAIPEFEACREVAESADVPIRNVMAAAKRAGSSSE